MKKFQTIIVVNDYHVPFHDIEAHELFKKFLRGVKPEILVLNGDILDCFDISKFSKNPVIEETFREEIGITQYILKEFRIILPKAKIYYIEGNHEFRLKKYLMMQAKELYWVKGVHLENLLDLEHLRIKYFPIQKYFTKFSHNYIQFGDLYVGHFDKALKHGGNTARMLRDELGVSLVQAHVHRCGLSARTFLDGVKIGYENGCMSMKPSYVSNPDWQLGWCVVYWNEKESKTWVNPIILKDYEFVFEGKYYST